MNRPFTRWIRLLVFATLVGLFYASLPSSAGQTLTAEDPLEVHASNVRGIEGTSLTWGVTNRSNKEIVAYTIVAELSDSGGKHVAQMSSTAIMNLTGAKDSTSGLTPGATGRSKNPFHLPLQSNGQPVASRVFVDYVLFKDGSTWGPDSAKQSLKIMGTLDGWRMSRAQLKRLLAERGMQAVADALAE